MGVPTARVLGVRFATPTCPLLRRGFLQAGLVTGESFVGPSLAPADRCQGEDFPQDLPPATILSRGKWEIRWESGPTVDRRRHRRHRGCLRRTTGHRYPGC